MEQRTKLLVGSGAIVVILLIITAGFFISKSAKPVSNNSLNNLNTIKDEGGIAPSPVPTLSAGSTTKTYVGQGFSLRYPNSWGLLTCSNSSNFELDPTNPTDQKEVICNQAVKPITVLVSENKGNCNAGKKTWNDGQTDYRWCVNIGKVYLDITHRVSSQGFKATSATDYSLAVDEMVRTLSTNPQGS